MYDERFCRMWEFYLISAEMMFRTGSQEVFHMQLARKRDAAPIVRDYITDVQRRYEQLESGGHRDGVFRYGTHAPRVAAASLTLRR